MKIKVRALIHGDVLKEPIDTIHKTFTEEITRELSEAPNPRDTGFFAESWVSERTSPETTLITNTSGLDTFLLGTGLWGRGTRICAREYGHDKWRFFWRAIGKRVAVPCIKGINPHRVLIPGGEYDFPQEMEDAVIRGTKIAVRRLNE